MNKPTDIPETPINKTAVTVTSVPSAHVHAPAPAPIQGVSHTLPLARVSDGVSHVYHHHEITLSPLKIGLNSEPIPDSRDYLSKPHRNISTSSERHVHFIDESK